MADANLAKELEDILRSYFDDDDFAKGTVFCLKTEENWKTMLEFIAKANELGDEITHDDLLALSIVLEKRMDKIADNAR